jgi:tripartite-type tricarboxylate transporter receptor subunit TctC
LILCSIAAIAQTYPNRPVRMIVAYPPGGPTDILSRIFAQKLSDQLGRQVIVDNRGGAGAIIGFELGAKSDPDGYTIVMGTNGALTINPYVYARLPYDSIKDFAPVSLIATAPSILVVHPAVMAKSVQELIALAKANPGRLNYASGGVGTSPHLSAELFKSMAGVNIVHVPYKGGGPALADTVAGHVEIFFPGIMEALPLVRDGKLRGLGVTTLKRTANMPDMPTIAESGLPGFDSGNWYGPLTPAKTPQAIITKLHSATLAALALPDTKKRMLEVGADAVGSSPQEFSDHIRSELARMSGVVRAAGIRPD